MGLGSHLKEAIYVPRKSLVPISLRTLAFAGVVTALKYISDKLGYSSLDLINTKFILETSALWLGSEWLSYPSNNSWKKEISDLIPEKEITSKFMDTSTKLYAATLAIPTIAGIVYESKELLNLTYRNISDDPSLIALTFPALILGATAVKAATAASKKISFSYLTKAGNIKSLLHTAFLTMSSNKADKLLEASEDNYLKGRPFNPVSYVNTAKTLNKEDEALRFLFKNIFLSQNNNSSSSFQQMDRSNFIYSRTHNSDFELFVELSNTSLPEGKLLQDHFYQSVKGLDNLTLSQKVLVAWYSYMENKPESTELWRNISRHAKKSENFKKVVYKKATSEINRLECVVGSHSIESVLLFKQAPASSKEFKEEYLLSRAAERISRNNSRLLKIPVFDYEVDDREQSFTMIHPQARTVHDQAYMKNYIELRNQMYRILKLRSDLSRGFLTQENVDIQPVDLIEIYVKNPLINSKAYVEFINEHMLLLESLNNYKLQPRLDLHSHNLLEKAGLEGKVDHQNKGLTSPMFDFVDYVHLFYDVLKMNDLYSLTIDSVYYFQEELTGNARDLVSLHTMSLIARNLSFMKNWSSNRPHYHKNAKNFFNYSNMMINVLAGEGRSSLHNHIKKYFSLESEIKSFINSN